MRIDTCMFNGCLFSMGAGVGILFRCVLKLFERNELLLENFWGPLKLSSSCDNNYKYVKHVSFKNIIFARCKMMKTPLRIHAKSLSDALAPSKKKRLRLVSSDCARNCICSWSAHCLPDFCRKGWSKGVCRLKQTCADFCQKGWSKGVCRLKQICTPTGVDPKYVTTIPDVHIWITQSI